MECTSCHKNLEGDARVEIDGKPYCATDERLAKLEADNRLHKTIDEDGKGTINNFASPRSPR